MAQRPIHTNHATIVKTFPHTIRTNDKIIKNSTPTTPSERTGMINGHSPQTTIQFSPKNQQICRGKLCHSFFTPDKVTIFNGEKDTSTQQVILQGWRDPATGLWRNPIVPEQTAPPKYTPTSQEKANLSNQHMIIDNVY